MAEQLNLLKSILENEGLIPISAANSEEDVSLVAEPGDKDYGRVPRLVRSVSYMNSHGHAQMEAEWPLEWCSISEGLLIGSTPIGNSDVNHLVDHAGVEAIVSLLTPQQAEALGIDMEELKSSADLAGALFLSCSVSNPIAGIGDSVDFKDLRDALRVVAALLRTGQRVLVCCTFGTSSSALLALCYLTFVKGMPLTGALAMLRSRCRGCAPSLAAWEEAKTRLSEADVVRLAQLADIAQKERTAAGSAGTAMDDWMAARQQLLVEIFNQQAEADVALAAVLTKGTFSSQVEPEVVRAAEASASGAGEGSLDSSSLDTTPRATTKNLGRQTVQAAVERAVSAELEAESARDEARRMQGALQGAAAESRRLSAELAAAERQLAEAQVERRRAERTAGAAAAHDLVFAQAALEAAFRQEAESVSAMQKLEGELRLAARAQAAATDRLAFLERETVRLRAKEEAARAAAEAAVKGGERLVEKLERAETAGSRAQERAELLAAELEALQQQNRKAEETEAEMVHLKEQVAQLTKSLETAKATAAHATDRSAFLGRQMVELRAKLEAANEREPQVSLDEVADATVKSLRAELAKAREEASVAARQRDEAFEQVAVLKQQLSATEAREQEALRKLLEAENRIAFLLRQLDVSAGKREAAEGALNAAQQQVRRLARNVSSMKQRLFSSASRAGKASSAAEALTKAAEELYTRLETHAKRLQESIASSDLVTGQLGRRLAGTSSSASSPISPLAESASLSPQAKAAVGSLTDAVKAGGGSSGPAAAALVERTAEAISTGGGEGAKLADVAEQERLLQDVTCLREAVAVLEASKDALDRGNGHAGNGAHHSTAVGLFNELVKGTAVQNRVLDPVAATGRGLLPQGGLLGRPETSSP